MKKTRTHLLKRIYRNTICLMTLSLLLSFQESFATVTISGGTSGPVLAGNPYATLASAISALNGGGALTSSVILDVSAGHTETLTGRITLTLTGTAANTITIQKSGVGANPLLTAHTGVVATPGATSPGYDAMFVLLGTDYVTIDGIDLQEAASNTTNTTLMEYGYVMARQSATNGCQNNTIKNCKVTLNRNNTNTWGIGITDYAEFSTTAIVPTAPSGANSFNKIYSNILENMNVGIFTRAFAAPSPFTLGDTGNDIGGNSSATGNTVKNFGGATTSAASNGIFMNNQWDANCSFNTINNNDGAGINNTNVLRGIFLNASSTSASVTCNDNVVSVFGAGTTHEVTGISVQFGNTAAGNTINVNNNNVTGSYLTATTGTFWGVHVNSTAANVNINNNNVHDMSYGGVAVTGTGTLYPVYNQGACTNLSMRSNIVNNINRIGTTGGTTIGVFASAGTNQSVKLSAVSNLSIDGAGTASIIYGIQVAGTTVVCDSNTVFGIQVLKTTGTSALYGIYNVGSPNNENYNFNTVYNISHAGTGVTAGILNNTAAGIRSVANNTIYDISSNGTTVTGITSTNSSPTIARNRIYNVTSNSSAAPIVSGISLTSVGTSGTATIVNNLIGNIYAPNANTASVAAPTVRGISLSLTTAGSTVNVLYNTVYLNASSAGANFGSTALFHAASFTAPSTTANLTLRNNILYNNSTAAGIGLVSAYQRSTSNKANYNSASDRNVFYGGAGANQLIFTDTVAFNMTLADYQTTMLGVGADQNSYEENVVFQSTVGSSPDFLKWDISNASVIESGAANLAGVTNDYASTIRQGNIGYAGTGSAPDVGAWELEGIASGGCAGSPTPANTVASTTTPCTGANFTLSLDQVYGLGYSFQWEMSTTGPLSGFNPVLGATNATLIANTFSAVWYRCIVKCVASNDSIISTSVGLTITTLSGAYTIDNTGAGDYISFYDAIVDLSCKGISGPVVFNVVAGQTFIESNDLNCSFTGTSTNTITFQKSGSGANPKIQRTGTASTTDYVIRLTGADYYIFDGIDFEQTGTSASDWTEFGIHLFSGSTTNGCSNNIFKNGVVTLSNANVNAKGVFVQTPFAPISAAGTSSNNRFLNMLVQNSFEGYRFNGLTTSNFLDDGNEVNIETGGDGGAVSTIQNLGDGTTTGSVYGVFATFQTNLKVKNTDFNNFNAGGTSLTYGVTVQSSASNTFEISNNTMHDIDGFGTVTGIHITSAASASIYNNVIHDLASASITTGFARGMNVAGTGLISTIYNNRVYNISSTAATSGGAVGIEGNTGIHTIYNNMVSDIRCGASTTTTGGTRGISITSGTTGGTTKIYFNTIYLNDVGTVSGYTSAALHNSSTTPNLDIRNNVVINNSDVTIGTRAVAFWKTSTTDNIDSFSNNNLYFAGVPDAKHLIYYNGTSSYQTIASYQGLLEVAPGETNSVTENTTIDPIVNGAIRPNAATPTYIESGALPIAGFTQDFENDTRNVSTPDMGADEGAFTIYVPPVPDCATYLKPTSGANDVCSYSNVTLVWNAPITGGPINQGYDVYLGTSNNPALLANVNTTNYPLSGLLPNTTYFWKIVPKNTTGDAVGCLVDSFTTIDAQITSTQGDTVCGFGVANLSANGSGTINWYSDAGATNLVATGASFNPVVSSTTTYYVSSTTGFSTATMGRSEALAGTAGTTPSTYGLCFNASQSMTIDSVTLILNTTAGGTLLVQLRDSLAGSSGPGTNIVATANITIPVGTIGQRIRVPLGFSVPAGNGYRLLAISGPNLIRSSSAGGYPYTASNGVAVITSGFITNSGNTTYYYFYDWKISSGCQSSPIPVEALVTPADTIAITPSTITRCELEAPSSLNASSTSAYNYTWSPNTGINSTVGSSVLVNPSATTTYTVIGTDGTCSNSALVNVNVLAAPANLTASVSTPSCEGDSVTFNATSTSSALDYSWSGPNGFSSILQNPGLNAITNVEVGTYSVTATNAQGCTATATVQLNVHTASNNSPNVQSACDSYLWSANGQTYTVSGIYMATLVNVNGCDSIVTLNLTINLSTSATTNTTANGCYTWNVNGMSYSNSGVYVGTLTNSVGCDSVVTLNLTINPGLTLACKAMLSGAYDVSTGMMHDSLRVMNQIPNTEPYSASPYNRPAILESAGETIGAGVLLVSGANAIVDWVYIEIRDAVNPLNIVATKRALIQRDGDVVSHLDGTSPVFFSSLTAGNYYVSIKHRNHLGVMTSASKTITSCSSLIDFTTEPVWVKAGEINVPRRLMSGVQTLWGGDAMRDKNTKYNGGAALPSPNQVYKANDKEAVLISLGGIGFANNTLSPVYRSEDVNMDGKIRYNNSDNDRLIIANMVGVSTPNNVVNQHTPN